MAQSQPVREWVDEQQLAAPEVSKETLAAHLRAALQSLKLQTAEVEAVSLERAAQIKHMAVHIVTLPAVLAGGARGVHLDVVGKRVCASILNFAGDAPATFLPGHLHGRGAGTLHLLKDFSSLVTRGHGFYIYTQPHIQTEPYYYCIFFVDPAAPTIPLGYIYGTDGGCPIEPSAHSGLGKGKWVTVPLF